MKIPPLSAQKCHIAGGRGGGGGGGGGWSPFFVGLESLYCCELGAHAKFENPTITPSGRKVTQAVKSGYMAVESGYRLQQK